MSHEDELTLLMINVGAILLVLFLRRALDHRIIGIIGFVAGAALLIGAIWRELKSRYDNMRALRSYLASARRAAAPWQAIPVVCAQNAELKLNDRTERQSGFAGFHRAICWFAHSWSWGSSGISGGLA